MLEKTFIYEVAFSFLAQDEKLAFQLHSALQKTVSSFIYSEQQKRLAGSDGEVTFNKVFGEDARIVVILYRESWGKTPWTRIEETAIKNRAMDEGYDFTLFIPLDKGIALPNWVPKTRLWFGLERFGIEGAIAVIEAKIVDTGGEVKVLSTADKVRIANVEINKKANRDHLLQTQGIFLFNTEVKSLLDEYKRIVNEILLTTPDWHLKVNENENGIDIVSYGHQLIIDKNDGYYDYMRISLWIGIWPFKRQPANYRKPEPKLIFINEWIFDINEYDQHGWSIKDKRTNFTTTSQMAKSTMERLIDLAVAKKSTDIQSS